MVVELETLADDGSHPIGETFGVDLLDLRQQHRKGVASGSRHPVGLTEVVPDRDADALDDAVAGAVTVARVDLAQLIDVEQDDGKGMAETFGALDLLLQRGDEDRPGMERGQRVDN